MATYTAAPILNPEAALDALADGAVLVTANRRLARSYRQRYTSRRLAAGAAVWASPEVLPWGAWIDALWDRLMYATGGPTVPARLAAPAERLLWERIVRQWPEAEGLLSAAATADAAAASWRRMHEWRLSLTDLEDAAGDDTRVFAAWSREFEKACASGNWIDAARLPDRLAGQLGRLEMPGRLLLAGFDETTPQQSALLAACREAGVSIASVRFTPLGDTRAVRVAVAGRRQELEAAARWARGLVEKGATGTIAVVVPDLAGSRRRVERVFASVLQPESLLGGAAAGGRAFNLSAGAALSEYPLVRVALLALSLAPDRHALGPLGALLRSPYLSGGREERSGRALLDAKLRRLGAAEVPVRAVRRLCKSEKHPCPILRKSLAAWQRVRSGLPEQQSAGGWAHSFSQLLAKLGWPPGTSLSSEEFQTAEAWTRMLSEFARLDAAGGVFTYSDALARLRRLAEETPFQPESEAGATVQVLGLLETSGASFDHLWVTGMDDESWPRPPRPDPFLPVALQRLHQLPHSSPEREMEFARAESARLLASAADVVVSHAQRDGDRELSVSPLFQPLPQEPLDTLGLTGIEDLPALLQGAAGRLTEFEDYDAPPLEEGARQVRGGANVFKYQALCPFRAFAQIRLGANPLESPEPGLAARDRGTLVHAALENIWKALETHERLVRCSGWELAGLIAAAVRQAMEKLEGKREAALPPRLAGLESERLERLLADWLELEKQREPFRVIQPEGERAVEVAGVSARVRIDRIDEVADGRQVVIDYKTGAEVSTRDWDGDRPSEPQVPLYAATHPAPLAAAVFGHVKTGKLGFKGVVSGRPVIGGKLKPVDLRVQVEQWRRTLEKLGEGFRSGRAEVDPKRAAECRSCPLASFCRIGEADLSTSAAEGEE